MDTRNSLAAEFYHWGHFDVLQNAAEQFAQNGKVNYQQILTEKIVHHLRSTLHLLPQHQSLEDAVKEWFCSEESFPKERAYGDKEKKYDDWYSDWYAWNFPKAEEYKEGKKYKEKEFLFPVMHLCKLAVDAFDIAIDGRLCRPEEDDIVHFNRSGCVPPSLLGAVRYAMKKELKWDGKNTVITSKAAPQEFEILIRRGLADAHVHLSGAVCFIDLFYAAIRGMTPPVRSQGGEFLENGNTHGIHDFPFHHLMVRPLLLACKTMLAALLYCAEKQKNFKDFLGTVDDTLSKRFWLLMYRAAKQNDSSLFEISAGNILKKTGNYKRFFKNNNNEDVPFEKNWFTITRYVLENQNDKELCYHFTQLTRCICCLYRPMSHREGFYEFDHLFSYINYFIEAAGNPKGRPNRRYCDEANDSTKSEDNTKSAIGRKVRTGIDSMRNRCKYLRRLQLRINVQAEKRRSRPLCRPNSVKRSRKPLITEPRLLVDLQNHIQAYKTYLDGKINDKSPFVLTTFPIHFVRHEKPREKDKKKQRPNFHFRLLWHRVELLAALFLKNPYLRYFFGRIDVANNEDLKPNWVFALMFQELDERLKKIKSLKSETQIPGMRYNCHAGEHFSSSIQGLRRIWEPVHYFPHLDGLGHALALGISDRFPAEMPADELLDDLVWILLHREHIKDVSLAIIERTDEQIAEIIYGGDDEPISEILFRDLKDAYRWRFRRKKIAKYVGILCCDKKTGQYRYDPDFILPKDEDGKPLPKAARILQKYFTRKEVGQSYKLSNELRETLEKCYPFLREFVKQEIIKKNVIVEVCPASNFRIGHLTKLEDHPLFAMCPSGEESGISVVFGTDDPSMFQTSIDEEYLFVKKAMDKKYPALPQEKRLEYLETIRRRSMELCCDDLLFILNDVSRPTEGEYVERAAQCLTGYGILKLIEGLRNSLKTETVF